MRIQLSRTVTRIALSHARPTLSQRPRYAYAGILGTCYVTIR